MTKNILITGANGQLGNEMRLALNGDNRFITFFTDVNELDITNEVAVNNFIKDSNIDIIINCAAYTAVDKAEDDSELCSKLNINAVATLAKAATTHNAKLIHISTDYVYDGLNHRPYIETDTTNPQSIYGTTKLEGEMQLFKLAPNSIIIRTAWLYSPFGKNFVKTMINLGRTNGSLNVICDQVGTPTCATDLASAIMKIITADNWISGIFHFSNEGAISWYDFTKAIHRIAGIKTCTVNPVTSSEYKTKAARPFYSVLNKAKIKNTYGFSIPYWEESLEKCIKIIENDNK
ncbi:MAG: dTDP-4-dehydrorhamnose reductase [Muribaculaceae bacterium]